MGRGGEKLMKRKTKKNLIKELDRVYSLWLRKSHSVDGIVQCYTCHQWLPINKMDCGHYWSRKHMATRWYEKNTKPQCRYCNRFSEGNKPAFAMQLINEYGSDILNILEFKAKAPCKFELFELEEKIKFYKEKLK